MKNADQRAFPHSEELHGGLTKREYFAAQILGAILSNGSIDPDMRVYEVVASMTDGMLKELEK